eukprot:CAMPEP_0184299104 /NCGR_PEP_ID=MMETSP1049-20130417/9776_1 /TAXON_ID=77928 /ORGANISM="Proteomonas sulcata, Strain CCMP704" /LENGTH=201 /DNA_ID=CAMNT_0026609439 /DNA_START=147 /DNA_END=752 /DNA_ORIENTATION=+
MYNGKSSRRISAPQSPSTRSTGPQASVSFSSFSPLPHVPATPNGQVVDSATKSSTFGTPGFNSPFSSTPSTQRMLQIINMSFFVVKLEVWHRDGLVILSNDIPPNGSFPSDGTQWNIPPGKDLCFSVEGGAEEKHRSACCLPEFDRRSVRVRVEMDSTSGSITLGPFLKNGKPIAGNIDAYSLRLNTLPVGASPAPPTPDV